MLAVKSSGVLEHAGSGSVKRWDPRLGVAWLSSCKIVRFEYSYCFLQLSLGTGFYVSQHPYFVEISSYQLDENWGV